VWFLFIVFQRYDAIGDVKGDLFYYKELILIDCCLV
jgi:hypothetical protein